MPKPEYILATVNGQQLTLEVARTPETRKQGLSKRLTVPHGMGMLFVFPTWGRHSFWMKDTYQHLAVYWLDGSGVIVDKARMAAETTKSNKPGVMARYAIEVPLTWEVVHQPKVGDRFTFTR